MATPIDSDRGEDEKTLEPVRRTHVLLVEDNDEMREMRKMLASVLTRHGYRVTEACDGSRAHGYLVKFALSGGHEGMPHLLVTDQRMPGICGLDVIAPARISRLGIPAILMNAFGDAGVRDRARALGTTVLEKPFEMPDLMALVRFAAPPWQALRMCNARPPGRNA
jgi:CheY-like chemotaxis protein